MATITPRKDKQGRIISYKVRLCVGRDEQYKQIWRTCTIPRPDGLTPAKELKEIERQADAWEKEQREEYDRSHSKVDKTKITLAVFIRDHWWRDHVLDGSHKPTTTAFYRSMADDIITFFGEKKRFSSINAESIKRYVVYLNTEARTKSGEQLSDTTARRHFETLRNIVNYGLRLDYLKEDPFQKLTAKDKPRRSHKEIEYLSTKDATRFVQALEGEPLFWRCFMMLLITSGLRRGEAVGLQWSDIDKENHEMTIHQNVTVDRTAKEKYAIVPPKSGEPRVVAVQDEVLKLIQALKLEREKNSQSIIMPHGFVFSRDDDPYRPIMPDAPTKWQARFVRRHGLPHVSPHDLRHTCATLALESGSQIKNVQDLLGHSDPATTMAFYAAATKEAQRRTVDGIARLIMPQKEADEKAQ